MQYSEQIKSPKWQKKRLEILKRDDFTCQECGNNELTLHVHHKHYNKGAKIWEYKNWELTTLCENCHSKTHKKSDTKQIKNIEFLNFINDNFNDFDIENLMFILSHIPENNDCDIASNEFIESLAFCFNHKGFPEKLFFDISQIMTIEYNSIDISKINSFLKRINEQ